MMMRKFVPLVLIGSIVLGALFLHPIIAQADTSITPSDLIELINNWRVNRYGFAPLTVDPILMSTAQYTAQFMADNHLLDHMANLGYGGVAERIALAGYNNGVTTCATENWAYAFNTINEIAAAWEDVQHQYPASKEQYKNVGAGVATGPWGTYYIIHAACASSGSTPGTLNPNTTIVATIDNRIQPVITSTPQKDGSIYHIVESGQALWSIAMAYNTKVDTIKKLNSLTNDMVYVGMKLLIQPAVTPTVSPTVTSTSIPPMRTPTHPVTPRPPTATFTPIPSPTPTSLVAGIPNLNRHNLGLLIIVICAIGLLAVGALSIFHRPSKVTGTQDKEH